MNDLYNNNNEKKTPWNRSYYLSVYRLFAYDFLKGETKTPNGDVPNPDDPFGDDEDHEKLAALAKSFEEKYVSYFRLLQTDQLMYIGSSIL